jgi:hypothetical protein
MVAQDCGLDAVVQALERRGVAAVDLSSVKVIAAAARNDTSALAALLDAGAPLDRTNCREDTP